MKGTMSSRLKSAPWIWSVIGIFVIWLALALTTGRLGFGALAGVIPSASFLAIAAIAQSFAIVTGGGNADLSIPNVITLSAYVSMGLIAGSDSRTLVGVVASICLGLAIGGLNALLIVKLRVPSIIATLAMGFIAVTFVLLANNRATVIAVSPSLRFVAADRIGGIPIVALFVMALAALVAFCFHRTAFGQMLMAVGQNRQAARLAGIPVGIITALAFMISGGLAGLDGALLAAKSGGAFLDLGSTYLLQSVGAVVIGGSPPFGGRTTVLGTLAGSLLLVLLAIATQIVGLPAGAQEIVQGATIIAVLAIAGSGFSMRRSGNLWPWSQKKRADA